MRWSNKAALMSANGTFAMSNDVRYATAFEDEPDIEPASSRREEG